MELPVTGRTMTEDATDEGAAGQEEVQEDAGAATETASAIEPDLEFAAAGPGSVESAGSPEGSGEPAEEDLDKAA
jgi:hypothetical protein